MGLELVDGCYNAFTVHTAPGRVTFGSDLRNRKSRLWVLEDRTVVVVVAGSTGVPIWETIGNAEKLCRDLRNRTISGTLDSGEFFFREASCACGMGSLGSAGPTPHRWEMFRVRRPDWFEEI